MQNRVGNQRAQKRKYEPAECLSAVKAESDLWQETGNNNMKAQT